MAIKPVGKNERSIKMLLKDFERHSLRAIEEGGISVGVEELLANGIRLVRQHSDLKLLHLGPSLGTDNPFKDLI